MRKVVYWKPLPASLTVTVALALVEPWALVAVSVYSVVVVGCSSIDAPVTAPTAGSMRMESLPLTCQLRVALFPGAIVAGLTIKLWITGAAFVDGGVTWTSRGR
jgi:hypothetical protein